MSALSSAVPVASAADLASPDPVVANRFVSSVLIGILAVAAIKAAPIFALIGAALLAFIWPMFVASWRVDEAREIKANKEEKAISPAFAGLTSAIVRPAALGLR